MDAHVKQTDEEMWECLSFETALSSKAAATVQAEEFKGVK